MKNTKCLPFLLFFPTFEHGLHLAVFILCGLACNYMVTVPKDVLTDLPFRAIQSSSSGKESDCNTGDLGSVSGLGRSPGEGKGYPLQYSSLENSMDCIVHEVAKSRTGLSDFTFTLLSKVKSFTKRSQSYSLLGGTIASGEDTARDEKRPYPYSGTSSLYPELP